MPKHTDPRLDELRRRLRKSSGRLSPRALKLVRAALDEPDQEITHEECQEALPACVDVVLEGGKLAESFPKIKRHLDTCDECAEQYADLLELSLQDQAGQIPVPEDIPEPDLSFLPSPIPLGGFIKDKAAEVLAALAPARMEGFQEIADVFFKRMQVSKTKRFTLQPLLRGTTTRSGQTYETLATIAVSYAATNDIINSFTPEQIDSLAAQDLLCARIEERARKVAFEIRVKPTLARKIAKQFAVQTCKDPVSLHQLIQQHKRQS